jgi:glucoamylase
MSDVRSEPWTSGLADWMARQYRRSAELMPRAISATHLVKHRPLYGQTIRAAPGSVLACADLAENPDFFFHWLRDSAVVIDALRVLIEDGTLGDEGFRLFGEFVEFSLRLSRLDGRANPRDAEERAEVASALVKNLRTREEMAAIRGDLALGEARLTADGRLDVFRWQRPQNDGPALRALAAMRYWRNPTLRPCLPLAALRELIAGDLDFTCRYWREPCYDLWEERWGRHYHTQIAQFAALSDGAEWARTLGDARRAESFAVAAQEAARVLDEYFDARSGAFLTPLPDRGLDAGEAMRLDFAVILGLIQAARRNGPHSPADPRALATLRRLEQMFDRIYRINQDRPKECGTAQGRYEGDIYFTGGAFYFSTLGAAEFYYRFALAAASGEAIAVTADNREILAGMLGEDPSNLGGAALEPRFRAPLARASVARGDAVMATVRRFAPETGVLAEQFSQVDGAPISAQSLAWSYASFITAFACRKEAQRAMEGRPRRP